MSIILYDDFESGNLSKWNIVVNNPSNFAVVVPGDANLPTKHVHIQSGRFTPSTGGRAIILVNGVVENNYVKSTVRWQNIQSGAPFMVIKSDAAFLNAYVALTDTTSRIFKVQGGIFVQLINPSVSWSQDTTYTAEFFQEPNGNLVLKQNGIIVSQVINNDLPDNPGVGMGTLNGANLFADDVFVDAEAASGRRRRILTGKC